MSSLQQNNADSITSTNPKLGENNNSSTMGNSPFEHQYSYIAQQAVRFNKIEEEIQKLKERQTVFEKDNSVKSFLDSAKRVSNISAIILIILIVLPICQLGVCVATVYILGYEKSLNSFINWCIGGIGILSLIELVGGCIKLKSLDERIKRLEDKIDR